jgi:hypothetical protein
MSGSPSALSLLDLIDRWHAYERDGDPEARDARLDLELRIASIRGFTEGLALATRGGANVAQSIHNLFDGA